ncbi:hypothetical protein GGR54DRAFT_332208 [Hypoxylon sp. NC1633]|nr:hypothetical protein GGR54DRAFT_332208 [Hypoxylon sp. NC1633]
MDPFTALSVAAAAVQFFDFARTLLTEYRERRNLAHSDKSEPFEQATEDLEQWISILKRSPLSGGKESARLLEHEIALRELALGTGRAAEDLLEALRSLSPKAEQSKWTSLAQALRSIWEADRISQLREQLENYRGQLVIRMLAYLNARMDISMDQQREQLNTIMKGNEQIIGVIGFHHQETHKAILELKGGGTRTIHRLENHLATDSQNSLLVAALPSTVVTLRSRQDGTNTEAISDDLALIKEKILSCLHFRQIVDRVESVKEAHSSTLQWVFDRRPGGQPWDDFPTWLEKGSGCYFIQGKAASGKSTLMKMIWAAPQTIESLSRWTNNQLPIKASFFFWYLGSPLQKSQEGLLRSLLHDLIHTSPELIPNIMPELFIEATKLGPREKLQSPSLIELTRWFRRLGKAFPSSSRKKICLFIDGLDEYAGDQLELVNLFLDLSKKTAALKFVLSSRPLAIFVNKFADYPGLRLQDLIIDDIRSYTTDLLYRESALVGRAEVQTLIENIAQKSCCVFLWVVVVVRSLLEGFHDGDTIPELLERVDDMPSELVDLYRHMLGRIQQNYRPQAAEMLQLVAVNFAGQKGNGLIHPFPAIQLSFALGRDSDFFQAEISQLTSEEEVTLIEQIERRVRSRCLGLIEIRKPAKLSTKPRQFLRSIVEPFHRTAMEFLEDPDVSALLKELTANSGFEPYSSLFCSTVRLAKILPSKVPNFSNPYDPSPWQLFEPALNIANTAELRGLPIAPRYLDELDEVLCTHWTRSSAFREFQQADENHLNGHSISCMIRAKSANRSSETTTIQRTLPPSILVDFNIRRDLLENINETDLHLLALVFPLSAYLIPHADTVAHNVSADVLTQLLKLFIHMRRADAAVLRILLEAGANPNTRMNEGLTPWSYFLQQALGNWNVSYVPERVDTQVIVLEELLKCFILHGADLSLVILEGRTAQAFLSNVIPLVRDRLEIEKRFTEGARLVGDAPPKFTFTQAILDAMQRTLDVIQLVESSKQRTRYSQSNFKSWFRRVRKLSSAQSL